MTDTPQQRFDEAAEVAARNPDEIETRLFVPEAAPVQIEENVIGAGNPDVLGAGNGDILGAG